MRDEYTLKDLEELKKVLSIMAKKIIDVAEKSAKEAGLPALGLTAPETFIHDLAHTALKANHGKVSKEQLLHPASALQMTKLILKPSGPTKKEEPLDEKDMILLMKIIRELDPSTQKASKEENILRLKMALKTLTKEQHAALDKELTALLQQEAFKSPAPKPSERAKPTAGKQNDNANDDLNRLAENLYGLVSMQGGLAAVTRCIVVNTAFVYQGPVIEVDKKPIAQGDIRALLESLGIHDHGSIQGIARKDDYMHNPFSARKKPTPPGSI